MTTSSSHSLNCEDWRVSIGPLRCVFRKYQHVGWLFAAVALIAVALMNCGGGTMQAASTPETPPSGAWPLTDAQLTILLSQKTFFGHQSVGGNIVQGINDLMAADPRLKLNMVSSSDPAAVSGAAFIEYPIGQNGDPRSKDAAFASTVNNGFGALGGIAMYKYCWIDINGSTDVKRMFSDYRNTVDPLQVKYPALKIVHITVPLTTDSDTSNVKRNEYNNLLRQTYAAGKIVDLAEAESTHADGSRSYFVAGGKTIYTLAPEYTYDGGHLNATGSQVAAKRMLITLANQ